jgi:DNA invertase Pin-like site-specific DNA recombinase
LLFFTDERVISGLKNARAKGKIIGRVRKRNDVLIHSLLDAGMSFRAIAKIASCSHGSVSASKKEWLAKKAATEKLLLLGPGPSELSDKPENPDSPSGSTLG